MNSLTRAYIALGSNLDNPREQLQNALHALERLPQSTLIGCSHAYRSAAIGPGAQPDYLNAVARLDTELDAATLLQALQAIENAQGRVRTQRWGPRTLDLDLLLFGDDSIDTATLQVPHPRLAERDFVLYPLREISDTNLTLPDGRDIDSLVAQLPASTLERIDTPLKEQTADVRHPRDQC